MGIAGAEANHGARERGNALGSRGDSGSLSVMGKSSSSSRHRVDTERRFAEIERRVDALEQRLAAGREDDWERKKDYARRRAISDRTVDRDIGRGLVERHQEPGTRRVYVRQVAPPPRPPVPAAPLSRRNRRRRGQVSDDAAMPTTTALGGPVWPFK